MSQLSCDSHRFFNSASVDDCSDLSRCQQWMVIRNVPFSPSYLGNKANLHSDGSCVSLYMEVCNWKGNRTSSLGSFHIQISCEFKRVMVFELSCDGHSFFLLAAAWVDPGRSALQSAEQWRKGRYGRMHQVVKCHLMTKTCKKAVWSNTQKQKVKQETIHLECQDSRRGLRWCPEDNIEKRWLWWNQEEAPMPEPVCKSQESGGYKLVIAMLAFNWIFRTKYCCGRSQVRGKPSSIGFP